MSEPTSKLVIERWNRVPEVDLALPRVEVDGILHPGLTALTHLDDATHAAYLAEWDEWDGAPLNDSLA